MYYDAKNFAGGIISPDRYKSIVQVFLHELKYYDKRPLRDIKEKTFEEWLTEPIKPRDNLWEKEIKTKALKRNAEANSPTLESPLYKKPKSSGTLDSSKRPRDQFAMSSSGEEDDNSSISSCDEEGVKKKRPQRKSMQTTKGKQIERDREARKSGNK